jgi:hypothetical protein
MKELAMLDLLGGSIDDKHSGMIARVGGKLRYQFVW